MSTNRKIRWAILGTSPISRTMAEAISVSESSELSAIGSRDIKKAEQFAKDFSIEKYRLNDDVLLDPEIDAVYIGLPNHLHKEWIVRCAMAGKAVLCEKPFVLSEQEMSEVEAVLKDHPVLCMEGLMYRCHPLIASVEKMIDEGIVGNIEYILAAYHANIAHLANPVAGGAIRNLGCYPMSLIRLLVKSEPVVIEGNGVWDHQQHSDHFASAVVRFDNGIEALITTVDNREKHWVFEVRGSAGDIIFKTNPWMPEKINEIEIIKDGQESTKIIAADKMLYVYQIDLMNELLLDGKSVVPENGVTLAHTRGNVLALERWRDRVKNSDDGVVNPLVDEDCANSLAG